jgi:hypothetical protein
MASLRATATIATVVGWLPAVAIREAWRLSRVERRDVRLDDLVGGEDVASGEGWETVIAGRVCVEHAVEARRALEVLAALPERRRREPRPVCGRLSL